MVQLLRDTVRPEGRVVKVEACQYPGLLMLRFRAENGLDFVAYGMICNEQTMCCGATLFFLASGTRPGGSVADSDGGYHRHEVAAIAFAHRRRIAGRLEP